MSCDALQPGKTLDICSVPLIRTSLNALGWPLPGPDPNDEDKPPVHLGEPPGRWVERVKIASSPDSEPPLSVRLSRLDAPKREAFVEVSGRLPPYVRKENYDQVGPE